MNIQKNDGFLPEAKPVDASSSATTVFIFGLLGLVLCQVLAPIAWIKGNEYRATCLAMGVEPNGLGVAGRVLGIVGTVLLILTIVWVGFWFVTLVAMRAH